MNIKPFSIVLSDQVIQLFEKTFTQSAGEAEGARVKQIVEELIATTPRQDICIFCALDDDQQVVGCIIFSALSHQNNRASFLLSPLAVSTNHQGQGIGFRLIRAGLKYLRDSGIDTALTYGDPGYYEKTGFSPGLSVGDRSSVSPVSATWLAREVTERTND